MEVLYEKIDSQNHPQILSICTHTIGYLWHTNLIAFVRTKEGTHPNLTAHIMIWIFYVKYVDNQFQVKMFCCKNLMKIDSKTYSQTI